jgi:hypothetical protein
MLAELSPFVPRALHGQIANLGRIVTTLCFVLKHIATFPSGTKLEMHLSSNRTTRIHAFESQFILLSSYTVNKHLRPNKIRIDRALR